MKDRIVTNYRLRDQVCGVANMIRDRWWNDRRGMRGLVAAWNFGCGAWIVGVITNAPRPAPWWIVLGTGVLSVVSLTVSILLLDRLEKLVREEASSAWIEESFSDAAMARTATAAREWAEAEGENYRDLLVAAASNLPAKLRPSAEGGMAICIRPPGGTRGVLVEFYDDGEYSAIGFDCSGSPVPIGAGTAGDGVVDTLRATQDFLAKESAISNPSTDTARMFAEGTRHIWDTPGEDEAWKHL